MSANYFHLFGAPIVMGRGFSADEDRPNGQKVAVLSYGLWSRRFGSDPNIVGKTISISGDPHVVVGVVGPSFNVKEFGDAAGSVGAVPVGSREQGSGPLLPRGRAAQAGRHRRRRRRRGCKSRPTNTASSFPTALQPNQGFSVTPFQEAFVKNVRSSLLVLVGAVSLVLLIACANVANLLLVRATGRKREIAIRSAIGAGRGRIMRQLLTESVVLSLAGGALGLVLGIAGIRALLAINTANLPRLGDDGSVVGADWRVLLFTLVVALGTGILFGLIPALQGSRADLSATLKESGGPSGSGFNQNKARSILVVVEVALALVLLIGSALLIRTTVALGAVDPGFDANNVLTMSMSLTGPRFEKAAAVDAIIRDGVERLRALPGVETASATCCVPLQGGYGLPFVVAGRPLEKGPFHGGAGWVTVSPGYFEVFKIPIKRGRTFNERDNSAGPQVVIINEAMAKEFWKNGQDPLADRLVIGKGVMREFATEQPRQIIGIVGDSRDGGLDSNPDSKMFIAQAQVPDLANALNVRLSPMSWVIRTRVEPHSLVGQIQEQLRQATGLPVSDMQDDERDRVDLDVARAVQHAADDGVRLRGAAARGDRHLRIDGVLGRAADAGDRDPAGARRRGGRRQEDGGVPGHAPDARRRRDRRRVRVRLVARFIASFLFGVKAWDPLVFVVIPLLLSAVALLAVWLPAGRASRVDPIIALRCE